MKMIIKHNLFLFFICVNLVIFSAISKTAYADSYDFTGYGNDSYEDEYEPQKDEYSSEYSDDSEPEYYYDEYAEYAEYDDYADDDEKTAFATIETAIEAEIEPEKPKIPAGSPIKLKEKVIRIGRIPYMSIKDMMAQVVPLLGILKKETGAKEVRLVSTGSNYSSILEALARGNIDFAWVSPTAYIKNREKDNLMAIAKSKYGEDASYRGVIIAPSKGRIQGLEDLKDSVIGFVDRQSASGYIYPMYLLKYLKIDLGKKHKIKFLKNHNKVLNAVVSGKVDAGCCLEETIVSSKYPNLDKKIIVLAKTPKIHSDVIVCRQDCPINLRESFESALIQIEPSKKHVKLPTFLTATDEEFESVEAVMRFLELIK